MKTWPQMLLTGWCVGTFLGSLSKSFDRGTPHAALAAAFETAVIITLLGMGGFFTVWGWVP